MKSGLKWVFGRLFGGVEWLLFPDNLKCFFCGKDVPDFESKPFCDECEKFLPFNNGNRCLICAEPIDNEANVCDVCQKNKRYFKKAYAPFVYKDAVRSAILAYKDSNQRFRARTFAKFIVEEIRKDNVEFDMITYIPMTTKKERARTFNQSRLLAQEIGKLLGVEVVCLFKKERDDKAQKFSTYKERQEKMQGLYSLQDAKLKKNHKVLIVDDIITTCSTINYCSKLISKKVHSVYVCAIARNKLKISHQTFPKPKQFSLTTEK